MRIGSVYILCGNAQFIVNSALKFKDVREGIDRFKQLKAEGQKLIYQMADIWGERAVI